MRLIRARPAYAEGISEWNWIGHTQARPVHPHGLRHTFTVTAVREGVGIPALQIQLGHSHLGTTTVYVRGLDPVVDLAA